MLLHDNKNISPHNILNDVQNKNLVLHEKQFCRNKKVDDAQKVIWCQQKQVDVARKSVSCQQNKLMLPKNVFNVDNGAPYLIRYLAAIEN